MEPLEVCAAVVFRGGKLLLATRRAGSRHAGLWEFPGGKCRPGEDFGACVERELCEELMFPVHFLREVSVLREERPGQSVLALHFLLCASQDDTVPIPQEGQSCGWYAPSEWASLSMVPLDEAFLQRHRAELEELAGESGPRE